MEESIQKMYLWPPITLLPFCLRTAEYFAIAETLDSFKKKLLALGNHF